LSNHADRAKDPAHGVLKEEWIQNLLRAHGGGHFFQTADYLHLLDKTLFTVPVRDVFMVQLAREWLYPLSTDPNAFALTALTNHWKNSYHPKGLLSNSQAIGPDEP